PSRARATASPAKLAPHTRTSQSRSIGVRSAPRLVARTGMRSAMIGRPAPAGRSSALRYASGNVSTTVENTEARVVEGSGGLLLEVDGRVVPNYDATMRPIEEGAVVTGHVVRIDKDEVLVDIGYKSEGVIPASELSIRKSVDPHDEVQLGEEVDALVLT